MLWKERGSSGKETVKLGIIYFYPVQGSNKVPFAMLYCDRLSTVTLIHSPQDGLGRC